MIRDELGIENLNLDPTVVPVDLRSLTSLAEQFGIGDDGVRDEAVSMMPQAFIETTAEVVNAKKERISHWAAEGDWSVEKSAFIALTQAFRRRGVGTPDAERLAALEQKLREFLERRDDSS